MPTVSPNMGLTIPTVSQTPGPEWASNINSSLSLVDSHDHSSGRGVPVTPAGMSISSALTFQGNAATDVSRLGLSQLGATLGVTILRSVYSVGSSGDLYYNNGTGTPVQITNGASLAGAAGTISGLPFGTASASFASDTFTWQQSTGIGAIMDSGPLKVRRAAASANYIQIQPPAVMAANWNLTLPPSAPASQAVMTVSSAGVATHATVDGTLTITSSLLKVASSGITATQLASNAVTTAKILNANVTPVKLSAKSVSSSSSVTQTTTSGTLVGISGLSVSFSARSGYPVCVQITPSGSGVSNILFGPSSSSIDLLMTDSIGNTSTIASVGVSGSTSWPANSLCVIITPSFTGTYQFAGYWITSSFITANNIKLVVYDI